MNILSIFFAILVFVVSLFGFHFPQKPPVIDDPPVCGGITDQTDPSAPKVIESKELTLFSTAFYLTDRYDSSRDGFYSYKLSSNEQGQLVLKTSSPSEIEIPVDSSVFVGVQEIIDRFELVKSNGVYRVTAGLPPEYSPWSVHAVYASGETLDFYENGDPYGEWSAAFKDFFDQILVENGHSEVLPPKEAMTIQHFSTTFNVDDLSHHYGQLTMGEGKNERVCLWHTVYDMTKGKTISQEYALETEEFYEGLQSVIEANDFMILHAPETVTFALHSSPDGFLEIYIDYENGRQIYAELTTDQLPEQWPAMKNALMNYWDEYLQDHSLN